ncbi:MAG: response regulator [Deltaproteobacteria bacterium]|nr:response regulator [Deltaproteobacteria bacterium]
MLNLFKRKPKIKSLLQALTSVASTRELERAIAEIEDWRDLIVKVSEIKKITEEQCLEKIALKLKIPYSVSVPACDVEVIPDHLQLADFRRAGAIPFTVKGKMEGVVCIDPSAVAKLDQALLKLPLYASTWGAIEQALDKSEKVFLKSRPEHSEQKIAKPNPLEQASRDVVSMLINEVSSYGGEGVLLTFDSVKIKYEFNTAEQKHGDGSINARVSTHLLRYLKVIQSQAGQFVHQVSLDSGFRVIAEFLPGNLLQVRLSWQLPKASSKETLNSETAKFVTPQILIVEDNDTFAKVLERFFELKGLDSIRFHNGEEALDYLQSTTQRPSICICDLHMPRMNGVTFLQNVRMNPALADLPVIVLTSDDDNEVELEVLSVGAAAFVSKNEDPKVLLQHVENLTAEQKKRAIQ